MGPYTQGENVDVFAAFTVGGVATDPTGSPSVKLWIKNNRGIESVLEYPTDAEIVHTGDGEFKSTIPDVQPGVYWYRWIGYGDAATRSERSFVVNLSAFRNPG